MPCAGRFYVPLDEDPLFAMDPGTNPLARARGGAPGPSAPSGGFPVARHAAYDASIWLPHELFLGDADDPADLLAAFHKVAAGADALRRAPPAQPVPAR